MASDSSSSSGYTFVGWLIMICLHFVLASAGACGVDDGRFLQAIQASGLTKPVKRGYDFFECGYGDVWVESFTAQQFLPSKEGDILGASVQGTMCCGILKGCTIRWP